MRSIIACLALVGPVSSAFAAETAYVRTAPPLWPSSVRRTHKYGAADFRRAGAPPQGRCHLPMVEGMPTAPRNSEGNAARPTRGGATTECKAH
jgi:hypothetical protein